MKEYLDATVPELAFGEYWDTCEYSDGVLNYNQDAHRQRTVNWCDRTGGTSAAFDFTTKGEQPRRETGRRAVLLLSVFKQPRWSLQSGLEYEAESGADHVEEAGGMPPMSVVGCAGILQEAMGKGEYWRLIDSQGRPPGLLGMWPSRAVSFIENHDTGEQSA